MTRSATPDIHHHLSSGAIQVRHALDQTYTMMCAAQVDPALGDTAQIILGEVLNNVVEHAYNSVEGQPIELSVWLRDDGLWCEVRDQGAPMPNGVPPAGVMPIVDADNPADLPEGGFGWALVRELTEHIQYDRQDGTNHLRFLIPTPKD